MYSTIFASLRYMVGFVSLVHFVYGWLADSVGWLFARERKSSSSRKQKYIILFLNSKNQETIRIAIRDWNVLVQPFMLDIDRITVVLQQHIVSADTISWQSRCSKCSVHSSQQRIDAQPNIKISNILTQSLQSHMESNTRTNAGDSMEMSKTI